MSGIPMDGGKMVKLAERRIFSQSFKPLSAEVLADIRKRAIVGQGVYTGPTMEYWKKPA